MSSQARLGFVVAAIFGAGFALGQVVDLTPRLIAQGGKVFELRTYTTPEVLLPNLQARFRDHTTRIFEKHGIHNVGYWVPQDAPAADNTLIYIIAHDSRQAAQASWDAFRADPEWSRVSEASRVDGQSIVSNVESVFMEATDFSPIK